MDYVFRLTENMDLKNAIISLCKDNNISAGCIVSAVGCLKKATIRLATAKEIRSFDKDFEIISLVGTICSDGVHLHIGLADENGQTLGGHLVEGSIVNTTCELVIRDLSSSYEFERKYDQTTGYRELVIQKK